MLAGYEQSCAIRCAALPVGAANASTLPIAWKAAAKARIVVVLPQPGPPVMMHLLPQQLDKVRFVATINLFFLLTNAAKLFPYAALGQFTEENLLLSLMLAPIVPLGVWSGLWLQSRVNHLWFYRIARLGMERAGA